MPRATMLLCDAAQVADGKLHILGAGWNVTGPLPAPSAIAILLEVHWSGEPVNLHWELVLEDADGRPAVFVFPDGQPHAVELRGDLHVVQATPPAPGAPVHVPLTVSVGPLPLAPGARYQWRLVVDGQTDDSWTLAFSTRPLAAAPLD